MSWILDLIVVAIILVFVFRSARRGFIRALVELAGFVLIFLAVHSFGKPLSNRIFDTFISEPASEKIESLLEKAQADTAERAEAALPGFAKRGARLLGIDIGEILGAEEGYASIAKAVTGGIVKPAATEFIYAVFSVLMFGVGLFLVRFIARFVNRLFSRSVIGFANRALGGALGALKGIVICCFLCYIITVLVSFTSRGFLIFTEENIASSFIFGRLAKFFSP